MRRQRLVSESGPFLVPAYPVDEVWDPTGAGDTFAGAFVGALGRDGVPDERHVREALLYGSVIASFAVQAFSLDRLAALSTGEIGARLQELRAMMSVDP